MNEQAVKPGSSVHHASAAPRRRRDDPPSGLAVALPVTLIVAALAATGAAVYVIAVSRISPDPVVQSSLTAIVCLVFVGAGVVALRLRPYARFGLLLAAVGFTSLFSVLHEANGAAAYTTGVLSSNLVFAVLAARAARIPERPRSSTTASRLLVAAAYADVLVLQAIAVLFDPLTRYHSDHPPNLALVHVVTRRSRPGSRRRRPPSQRRWPSRRVLCSRRPRGRRRRRRGAQLVPVLIGGTDRAAALRARARSSRRSPRGPALLGFGLGLVAALALPAAFLAHRPAGPAVPGGGRRAPRRAARAREQPLLRDERSDGRSATRCSSSSTCGPRTARTSTRGGEVVTLPGSGRHAGRDPDPAPGRSGRRPRPRPLAAPARRTPRRRLRGGGLRARERAGARRRCGGSSGATARCSTPSPTR